MDKSKKNSRQHQELGKSYPAAYQAASTPAGRFCRRHRGPFFVPLYLGHGAEEFSLPGRSRIVCFVQFVHGRADEVHPAIHIQDLPRNRP